MIRRAVEPMGYELVGVELIQRPRVGNLLRLYIDHPDGITLDDCSDVSHQVSGILDVEDPIKGHYDLEVSSPGLDRPLFEREHFERFLGHQVRLVLRTKIAGRRKIVGLLQGIESNNVLVVDGGEQYSLPLEQIDTARLVPEF
jgi:ribosome maturation factor RimP